jgi:hypothetical protein
MINIYTYKKLKLDFQLLKKIGQRFPNINGILYL